MDKKKKINIIREWIIPVITAILLAIIINKFLLFKVYIPSESMEPTINKSDRLFVGRIYNKENIKRGDILVFYSEEHQKKLIKRVIGLPGDKIDISKGTVNINGEIIEEDYVKNNNSFYDGSFKVPENNYFFLGDNRSNSNDSRLWINPYINEKYIEGKALLRVYPFNDFGTLK
ncbi:signal peptidase I [Clostridium sp.]|uniref:signal peptidase I n=1 Tax=Clostridium sp. TaxID=1506 RepID=UPI00262B6D6F|nr:signal peptidase I [Clostridium sp.]